MTQKLPLLNCRILVTRPKDQLQELCQLFADEGAVPIAKPLIEIGPPDDLSALDAALENLPSYDWVIFASLNAVKFFFERARQLGKTLDFGRNRIAVIGATTAAALKERGVEVDFMPSSFVAEAFVSEFPVLPADLAGLRFLWPKADIGRPYIYDHFTTQGAHVTRVVCYSTSLPANAENLAQELRHILEFGMVDICTFASSQTVRNFATLLATVSPSPESVMTKVIVAVIGPETADTARKLLPKVHVVAREHTAQGLVTSICKFVETNKLKFAARKGVN